MKCEAADEQNVHDDQSVTACKHGSSDEAAVQAQPKQQRATSEKEDVKGNMEMKIEVSASSSSPPSPSEVEKENYLTKFMESLQEKWAGMQNEEKKRYLKAPRKAYLQSLTYLEPFHQFQCQLLQNPPPELKLWRLFRSIVRPSAFGRSFHLRRKTFSKPLHATPTYGMIACMLHQQLHPSMPMWRQKLVPWISFANHG